MSRWYLTQPLLPASLGLPLPTQPVLSGFSNSVQRLLLKFLTPNVKHPTPIHLIKMGNFLPSLTEIIRCWPPDGYLGLIRKSPSRVQRPVSAVKIPHSPLSPLSSAKQPVSEDVPEIKGHTAALGTLTRSIHGPSTMNTAKSQMKVLISPLHSA